MNFANLKKQSKSFDKLLKAVETLDKPTYETEDTDNYWKPTPDKAGNALAVIRFLPGPAVDGEDALPWVRYWDHGFQNPVNGKWYIEKSLTSVGQKDPVSEYNTQLWNANADENSPERAQARDQKRRLHYVSNIYVVSDPKNPDNEGKVFLFKYGKKIFDKITKMMAPDLEDEKEVNPFDLWEGANFKLKVTRQLVKIGKRSIPMPNYDEAQFLAPGPLSEDDAVLETIWKSEYSLKEIVDPKNFKSYDELKKRLDEVLGLAPAPKPKPATGVASRFAAEDPKINPLQSDESEEVPWVEEEEDADLAMFRDLARED